MTATAAVRFALASSVGSQRWVAMSLAHAEVNTSRLLERVIDAAPGVRPDRDRG